MLHVRAVSSIVSTSRGSSARSGLGLAYGVLSGSCTFGFIAPILAIITVQQKIATGVLFILLFAIGHCLPIVVAGSSTAAVKGSWKTAGWQGAGDWFRKGAGVVIVIAGDLFHVNPFFLSSEALEEIRIMLLKATKKKSSGPSATEVSSPSTASHT